MAQVNLTYNEIIGDFRTACTEHLGIKTFNTGTIDFLDASSQNVQFPYVYLRPVSSAGFSDGIRGLSFDLFSIDVPRLSDQSPVTVLSNTEQFLYDLMAWFNYGPKQDVYRDLVNMVGLTPVNEAFNDRAFGWVASIQVNTPFMLDYCNYPTGSL